MALAIAAALAAVSVPALRAASVRSGTWAAARYLATRMAAARSYAVMHGAATALRFEQTAAGVTVRLYVDGDHDGLRTRDITDGIDTPIDAPVSIADLFPNVSIGIVPELGTDAVRIGSSDLLTFTPLGTATAGSIYVLGADGTQLAVRVLGATGRTRLERYVPATRGWVSSF